MNAESEKIDPKNELELGLHCSNQCIEKQLNNNSGAGANATSRLETTFVASGPLSELVWSADKGLCVIYADSSFAKNSSHFWDVGPSNVVLAQTRSIFGGMSATVEFQDDSVLKPDAAKCVMGDTAGINTPIVHPTSDSSVMAECKACEELEKGSSGNMDEMDTAERVSNVHAGKKENPINSSEKNICCQANIGSDQVSRIKGDKSSTISGHKRPFDDFSLHPHEPKPSMEQNSRPRFYSLGGGNIVSDHQALRTDDIWWTKVEPVTDYKGAGTPGTNLASSSRSPFEKLGSTAENDLRTANCDAACGAIRGVQVSKHNEFENKSNETEMMLPCDKNIPASNSPSNSRIHMLRKNKGKEKALSDGDVNVKSSGNDDDSQESVESCNSTGMFSMSKKRWNFQQQLIVESKRVKKQIPEASGSKSFVKQDSSFMNWISNMMKGFSNSIQHEACSLSLNLGHSDHGHQWPDQKVTDYTNQDVEPKITGFQSIFGSIYSSRLKKVGTRISSANHHPGEGSQNFELGDKVDGIDATPITCFAENNILHKPYLQSKEFEGSTWRYDSGPSSQPENEPINFVNSHESSKNDSVEDKTYCYLELGKVKEGITSNSSSDRQNTNNTNNIDSSTIPERKLADNISNRGDARGSLWITRLSRNSNSPLMISDHLNQTHGTHEHSTGFSKFLHSNKQVACLNKCKVEGTEEQSIQDRLLIGAKELQNCSLHKEASTGPKNNNRNNNDHKTVHLLHPMSCSSGFRNSEPMASTFARRLDAIKNIMSSNRTNSQITRVNMTCCFCGTRGHQLGDCSEISEDDLEDLLKNMKSYMGLEDLPCICIKCFQPDHWANACPYLISRGSHESEADTSVNDCSPSGIQFTAGNAGNARLLISEEEQNIPVGAIIDRTDTMAEKNLSLKQKSNEILALEDSDKKKLTIDPITSPCSFVERQISDIPKRIFDAVKRLRFSRADILKWKNSRMSISNLEGFFLRLRLGKWEEGLGGAGYYVASINGEERQSSQKKSRISLSVNVGEIRCMVESQFISNQEFLDDEIMAWWHAIFKAGGNIPSEEELMEKIKEKRMLGF